MRMLFVIAAVLAAPASGLAGADWLEVDKPAPSSPLVPLDLPQERVPGQALLKLHDVDPHTLLPESPHYPHAQKALHELEERTGVTLSLVRPSLEGWGLYELRERATPDERPSEARTLALVELLERDEAVAAASDERWYRIYALPNDPGVEDMWHLEAIGAFAAWDITTGATTQRIGVVDTGTVRDHQDLAEKDIGGWDFISRRSAAGDGDGRDPDYSDAGDGANCGNGYRPSSWHGTHVAGTILASANNGAGIAGVNWGASLVTARAMGKCGGALSDIMEAAAWLAGANVTGVPHIGSNRVSVMNLSLGGEAGCSRYEQDIIDLITGAGVVVVAAAGNNGGPVGSPANCTNVVSVAAHGPGANRPLAPYSSFGSTIEVVAPGGFINSALEQGVLSLSGPGVNDYTWQQGTSMAAPHVTGAISLLQVFEPELTRGDLAQLFTQTGDTCAGCGGVRTLRVDRLLAAIEATAPPQPPDDEPPADEPPTDEPDEPDEPPAGEPPAEDDEGEEPEPPVDAPPADEPPAEDDEGDTDAPPTSEAADEGEDGSGPRRLTSGRVSGGCAQASEGATSLGLLLLGLVASLGRTRAQARRGKSERSSLDSGPSTGR